MRPVGYGAPEVVGGRPYGTAADIFSFGVLAFVLLTGGLPYDEDLWDNTNKLDEATAAGRLVFDHSPEWRAASDEAKDFVQAAVAYSAHKRPHAVGLLRHKWCVVVRRRASFRSLHEYGRHRGNTFPPPPPVQPTVLCSNPLPVVIMDDVLQAPRL